MKKYIKIILLFTLVLVSINCLDASSATLRMDSGNDGTAGGYSHCYNMGTFGIQTNSGIQVMLVNHYAYANIYHSMVKNYVTCNYSAYSYYISEFSIDSEEAYGNFAWVKAKVYLNWGADTGYWYGQHGEYRNNASLMY